MGDEEVLKKFIIQKLERLGSISVQNLTGHLSQLPVRVRESTAGSKSELLKFIRDHSSTFALDKDGYISLAVDDEQQTRRDHSSSSTNRSKISPAGELPNTINKGKGKIVKLFPMFGFITAAEPFKTLVYFAARSFGDKSKTLIKDCGVTVGQTVCFNAILGNAKHDAKYHATKTWIPKSEENASLNSSEEPVISTKKIRTRIDNGLYDPHMCEGEGPVQNVFPKYGFIAINGDSRNTIFFCTKNICNYKNIVDLTQFLTVGDIVDYSAVRSTKPDSNVRWEATQVYIKQAKRKISIPNDSDDEKFISGPGDEDSEVSHRSADGEEKNRAKPSTRSRSNCNPNSTETKPPGIIRDCTGKIYVRSSNTAVIKFGKGNSEMAAVDSSSVYVYGSKVKEIVWEVEDGQTVFFNARRTDGPPGWQTSLVWIGSKPENVEKFDPGVETPVTVNKKFQDASQLSNCEKEVSSRNSNSQVASPVPETKLEYLNWADVPYSEEEEEEVENKDLRERIREDFPKEYYTKLPRKFESAGNKNGQGEDIRNIKLSSGFEKKIDVANSVNEFSKGESKYDLPDKSVRNPSNNFSCSNRCGKVMECEDVDSGINCTEYFSDSHSVFVGKEEKCSIATEQNPSASSVVSVNSDHNEVRVGKECAEDEDSDSKSSRFHSDSEDECPPSEDTDVEELFSENVTEVPHPVSVSQLLSSGNSIVFQPSHSKDLDKKENMTLVSLNRDGLSSSVQNILGCSSRIGKRPSVSDVRNTGTNNENSSKSIIDEFCGISGRIKSLFGYYGEVNCDKLRKPITFHSKDFYINEKPVVELHSSLKDALKLEEVVYMNCFEIVDDSDTVWQKVTLIWKGKKPRGCKEMLPEEFIKQLNLKVSCVSTRKKSRSRSCGEWNVKNNSIEREEVENLENSIAEAAQDSFTSQTSCVSLGNSIQPYVKDSTNAEENRSVGVPCKSNSRSRSSSNMSSTEALDFSEQTVIKDDSSGVTNFPTGPQVNCDKNIAPMVDNEEKCGTDYISSPVPIQEATVENPTPLQGEAAVKNLVTLQGERAVGNILKQHLLPGSIRHISEQLCTHLRENNDLQTFEDIVIKIASEIAKAIVQPVCSHCSCRKETCDQMVQTMELDSGTTVIATETEVKGAHAVSDAKSPSLVSTAVQTYSTGEVLQRKKWVSNF